jgi:hypothetical protein
VVGRLKLLGQRVAARHAAPVRAGGLRLARSVTAARRPERIVESVTRLARGRSIAPTRNVARFEEPLPRPAGMSEFAARWIFGDGPPEGIPIAGEAAMAELVPSETPSFIVERDEQEAQAAERDRERRSQPAPRGQIEEVRPAGFRLSRKPAVPPPVPARAPDADPIALPPVSDDEPIPLPAAPRAPEPTSPSVSVPEPKLDAGYSPEPASAAAAEPVPPPAAELPVPDPPAATAPPVAAEPPVAPEAPAPQEPRAESPEPPKPTESAPPAPQPSAPAPTPRPKLSVARAPLADKPARPALRVQPRDEPGRVPPPAGDPVEAPAAPRRNLLRRAVDAVLRRERPAPAEPAAFQTEMEHETLGPADTTAQVSARPTATSAPAPPRPAPQTAQAARHVADQPSQPPVAGIERAAAPPAAEAPAPVLESTEPPRVERQETLAVGEEPLAEHEAPVPELEPEPEPEAERELALLEPAEAPERERPHLVPAPGPVVASESAAPSAPQAPAPAAPGPSPAPARFRLARAPRAGAPETPVTPGAKPATPPSLPGASALLRHPVRTMARALTREPARERRTEQAPSTPSTPSRPLEAPSTFIRPVFEQGEASRPDVPAFSRVATSAAPRPPLRLVTAPQATTAPMVARTAAAAPASRPVGARAARTSGGRIAAATGGTVESDDGELVTVVFPRPAESAFAPAATLMRAPDTEPPAAPSPGPSPGTSTVPAPTTAPAPPPPPAGGGSTDIEEIYDQVMQRLRRDLLADRERMGDMLGDLP